MKIFIDGQKFTGNVQQISAEGDTVRIEMGDETILLVGIASFHMDNSSGSLIIETVDL